MSTITTDNRDLRVLAEYQLKQTEIIIERIVQRERQQTQKDIEFSQRIMKMDREYAILILRNDMLKITAKIMGIGGIILLIGMLARGFHWI